MSHPEITVRRRRPGDLVPQDRVIVPELNFMLFGAAFYRDSYRRTDQGWKICATGYSRTYEATMSLEA